MAKPRVIAYYLPQYYPVKENNLWWGEGFTEWLNVGKAKPLFPGHRQPKVPTALGYYDLRVASVREKQAQLAKKAGVEGFCYWHYWFGNGKRLLEMPSNEMLKTGRPDFPFCFGWANHPWEKKTWEAGRGNQLLIAQEYGGEKDYRMHFKAVLPFFQDKRYLTVDGKPIFLVYAPLGFKDCAEFITLWRGWARENGLCGIHFIAQAQPLDKDFGQYYRMGFDAVASNGTGRMGSVKASRGMQAVKYALCKALHLPRLVRFRDAVRDMPSALDQDESVYPQIVCGWDHTPRSGRNGVVFTGFSKGLFYRHAVSIFREVAGKADEHQVVFLKSWNEWGEGNFMEPDLEFGYGKIEALRKAVEDSRQF